MCLLAVATEELARDLIGDVVTMLTSSRMYIRKKATLVLYKLYLQYPQASCAPPCAPPAARLSPSFFRGPRCSPAAGPAAHV